MNTRSKTVLAVAALVTLNMLVLQWVTSTDLVEVDEALSQPPSATADYPITTTPLVHEHSSVQDRELLPSQLSSFGTVTRQYSSLWTSRVYKKEDYWSRHIVDLPQAEVDEYVERGGVVSGNDKHDLAIEALKSVEERLAVANITWFVVDGTLLGMERSPYVQFTHDADVGMLMQDYREDLLDILTETGDFHVYRQFSYPFHTGFEWCLVHKNGFKLDVFFYILEPEDGYNVMWSALWDDRKGGLTCPHLKNGPKDFQCHSGHYFRAIQRRHDFARVNYYGVNTLIPYPSRLWLEARYGQWQIPQSRFHYIYDANNVWTVDNENGQIQPFEKWETAKQYQIDFIS